MTPRLEEGSAVEEKMVESFIEFRIQNGETEDVAVPVTFRKLEGIQRLAEASARSRLSPYVEMQDVKRANELIGESMRQVGLDDSGSFDADIVEAKTSKSQRDRIGLVKDLIRKFEDGDSGAPHEKIIEAAAEEGIPRDKVQHELDKLRSLGEIYSPETDHYRSS